ncbi:17721_t:CDS:2 [Racocetra fulgida]|uniref:17721_t:CDS:1 n=1 Tax=Racocetra fulgida TaxID=60492 RepID=A0A9N9I7E8_9GLOM|nr:17721_t:CDS:2 [Racocetra fulgida]
MGLIASWIDRKDCESDLWKPYDPIEIPYKFDLIYRGSRDGFTPKIFHKACDNQGPTITVIKIKGLDQVIGGYNPKIYDGKLKGNIEGGANDDIDRDDTVCELLGEKK